MLAPEEDHLGGGRVVGDGGPVAGSRAGGRRELLPVGAVPGPGVIEAAVLALAAEEDHVAGGPRLRKAMEALVRAVGLVAVVSFCQVVPFQAQV